MTFLNILRLDICIFIECHYLRLCQSSIFFVSNCSNSYHFICIFTNHLPTSKYSHLFLKMSKAIKGVFLKVNSKGLLCQRHTHLIRAKCQHPVERPDTDVQMENIKSIARIWQLLVFGNTFSQPINFSVGDIFTDGL